MTRYQPRQPALADTEADLPPPPSEEQVETAVDRLQRLIALIAGLAGYITVSGAVIVHSHLARFTDIHGYTVAADQYYAAGAGFFIFQLLPFFAGAIVLSIVGAPDNVKVSPLVRVVFYGVAVFAGIVFSGTVVQSELRTLSDWLALFLTFLLGGITFILPIVLDFMKRRRSELQRDPSDSSMLNGRMIWDMYDALRRPASIGGVYILIFALIYVVIGGWRYSYTVYADIPRSLGGGKPASVNLIFVDDFERDLLGIAPHPVLESHSDTVLLLVELSDGLLVLDPTFGRVVAVNGDLLLGIVDDEIRSEYITGSLEVDEPAEDAFEEDD